MWRTHHYAFEHGLSADKSFLAALQSREQLHRRQKTQDLPPTPHLHWMLLREGTTRALRIPQGASISGAATAPRKPYFFTPQGLEPRFERYLYSVWPAWPVQSPRSFVESNGRCCTSPRLATRSPRPPKSWRRRRWLRPTCERCRSPRPRPPPFFFPVALSRHSNRQLYRWVECFSGGSSASSRENPNSN